MMKAVIAGGTGFVGKAVTKELQSRGFDVYILTRNAEKKKSDDRLHYVQWLSGGAKPEKFLEGIDVFINLAGESLSSGRWTNSRKERILTSRLLATRELVRIAASLSQKPSAFINASAIGIYPNSDTETFTENSSQKGTGFLPDVVGQWEQAAMEAEKAGIRTVYMRLGVVLGKEEGALPRLARPYQLGFGGKIGTGRQWVSWIHINDVARAIVFAAQSPFLRGPVNATAPNPVRMNTLGKTLAKTLHRPHWLFVPAPALKAALGEMSTVVVDGQKVLPEKLTQSGFQFSFPLLRGALDDIYSS